MSTLTPDKELTHVETLLRDHKVKLHLHNHITFGSCTACHQYHKVLGMYHSLGDVYDDDCLGCKKTYASCALSDDAHASFPQNGHPVSWRESVGSFQYED